LNGLTRRGVDLAEYEVDLDATRREREAVAVRFRLGEIDVLDALRR
jgi:hypothetical protein